MHKALSIGVIFSFAIVAIVTKHLIITTDALTYPFRISTNAKLEHLRPVTGAGTSGASRHLKYSYGKDSLVVDVNGETSSSSSSSSAKDDTYSLGLKPVINKQNKTVATIVLKSVKDNNVSLSSLEVDQIIDESVEKNTDTNTNTTLKANKDTHENRDVKANKDTNENRDVDMDVNMDVKTTETSQENWIATDKLVDLVDIRRIGNETMKDIESLLNITMPNPTSYISNFGISATTYADSNLNSTKESTSVTEAAEDLPSLASSFIDQGLGSLLNMTMPTSSDSSPKSPIVGPTTVSASNIKTNTTAANDLYALAASLMTKPKPPKMKRTKPLLKSPTFSNPNSPLTINDLQKILEDNGYVRREELSNITSSLNYNNDPNNINNKKGQNKTSTRKSGLAFPQPSLISTKHVRFGTAVSSSLFAMLIAISLQPNLWLIGSIMGAVLGNDIAEKEKKLTVMDDGTMPPPPGGLYGDVSLKLGKRIATSYLKVWDFIQGVWFMYRTGQLSYEYYKTYATLDQKFKIQDKMDAWNARFVEGKKNFDEWERDNEIGRKVLAGLRTVWMVEENSYRAQKYRIDGLGRRQSKYRLVQYGIDFSVWFKKLSLAVWNATTGGEKGELVDILKGVKIQIRELNLEFVSQRMGAAIAAIIAVNIVGAMFALAPSLLGIIAVLSGMIWPNWVGSAYQRIKELMEETRARGRGEKKKVTSTSVNTKANTKALTKAPLIDKKNFSYYVKENGRKQWYRTGQSMFSKLEEKGTNKMFDLTFLSDLIPKEMKNKKEEKRRWW